MLCPHTRSVIPVPVGVRGLLCSGWEALAVGASCGIRMSTVPPLCQQPRGHAGLREKHLRAFVTVLMAELLPVVLQAPGCLLQPQCSLSSCC